MTWTDTVSMVNSDSILLLRYDFQPGELLLSIINFILHITLQDHSRHDGFIVSMVKDPDFELTNLQKAQSVISSKGLGNEDLAQKMVQLIEEVNIVNVSKYIGLNFFVESISTNCTTAVD